jgi:hypothetical protein
MAVVRLRVLLRVMIQPLKVQRSLRLHQMMMLLLLDQFKVLLLKQLEKDLLRKSGCDKSRLRMQSDCLGGGCSVC